MTLANEVKREYPIKALFDSFVAGKRLAVDEVREALNPAADLREQLDRVMELVLMLTAANERLREERDKFKRKADALLNLGRPEMLR